MQFGETDDDYSLKPATLRSELEKLVKLAEEAGDLQTALDEIARLKAENSRLRKLLSQKGPAK